MRHALGSVLVGTGLVVGSAVTVGSFGLADPASAQTAVVARAPTTHEAGSIAGVLDDFEWFAVDMHLHTDHSSDAGVFHQEFDTPESHDTFLDEQRDQAIRLGMDGVAFNDHRVFDQHFDPEYRTTDGTVLMTGEEWGGARHGTAFGIVEVLEHDNDSVACGLAQMSLEAAAQGALFGIAHPKDSFGGSCIVDPALGSAWPISHVEAVRGGDGPPQELGLVESSGSNTAWYELALQGDMRVAAVNGSDNHFKQVWATGPAGPGGSATYALVAAPTEVGFIDAVRAGRTMGGWSQANVKLTTLLDADRDGEYDAVMGGWAAPASSTVNLAVRAELGMGGFVTVIDDAGSVIVEQPITQPDQTFVLEVPATSAFYYATYALTTATQVGLPDPLDYLDTHLAVASPVWTRAPGAGPAVSPGLVDGRPLTTPSTADWSGFPAIARSGESIHLAWQERQNGVQSIGYARSADGGASWEMARVLSDGSDARLPAIAVSGDRVTVAWEAHESSGLGGALLVATSNDAGATFSAPEVVVDGPVWRADVAADGMVDHLVWMQQVDGEVWSVHHRRRTEAGWQDVRQISTGQAFDGSMTQYAVPPRTLRWIPAAVNPSVDAHGGMVAIAWHDNRDDPTPGRSGSPDDWGIWASTSTDGGATFGPDDRVSPQVLSEQGSGAEAFKGYPARNADVLVLDDGAVAIAYQSPHVTGKADIFVQRSLDGGATWAAAVPAVEPSSAYRYQPSLSVGALGEVAVTWQQDQDPLWSLWSATSTNAAASFGRASPVTDSGRYAGWPATVQGALAFTAETPDGFAVHVVGSRPVGSPPGSPLPSTGGGAALAALAALAVAAARRQRS